jgi:hypothetical protein
MHATVVSCFYPVRSRRSPDFYLNSAREFLKLSAPIVLFTTKELAPVFESYRGEKPIRIISRPFEELDTWIAYENEWKTAYDRDPEKSYHSAELYAVWACKPFFVREAIEMNPFGTSKFCWCDISAFREPMTPLVRENFPLATRLPEDRLLIQAIESLTSDDLRMRDDDIPGDFLLIERIVDGFWGGTAQACCRWLAAYENMLIRYFCAGRFGGRERSVMTSAVIEFPNLVLALKCSSPGDHFARLLSDNTLPFLQDETYNIEPPEKPALGLYIYGGLGNQMFQIAAAYAHARTHNGNLIMENRKRDFDRRSSYWDSELYRFAHFLVDRVNESKMIVHTDYSSTIHNPLPNPIPNEGLWLKGFYQTSRYFQHLRKEIQYMFGPPPWIVRSIRMRYSDWFPFRITGPTPLEQRDRIVIVHCRRTDYCSTAWNKKFHGPLATSYYRAAMDSMVQRLKDPIFVLCGDDPNFWTENITELPALAAHEFHILDSTDVETMAIFSLCKHVIMANSTFSWWGALLSGASHVISPAAWFGPAGPKEYEDVYEPYMIRM